jgi:hypothetical protein
LLLRGPSSSVLIAIVLCSPVVALIVPELIEFWSWLAGKAEERAVDRAERIYRFGYAEIRMLMVGADPWFAATDICAALELSEVDDEIRRSDATRCVPLGAGGEHYFSEAAVMNLAERSHSADARSFRNWFTREVMSPFVRDREKMREATSLDHAK